MGRANGETLIGKPVVPGALLLMGPHLFALKPIRATRIALFASFFRSFFTVSVSSIEPTHLITLMSQARA